MEELCFVSRVLSCYVPINCIPAVTIKSVVYIFEPLPQTVACAVMLCLSVLVPQGYPANPDGRVSRKAGGWKVDSVLTVEMLTPAYIGTFDAQQLETDNYRGGIWEHVQTCNLHHTPPTRHHAYAAMN